MTFKQNITCRYIFALSLIAIVLMSSYATLMLRMHQNEDDARVINRAGQQRMLSQRVALLMREIVLADSQTDRDTYTTKLDLSLQKMRDNHAWLHLRLDTNDSSESLMAMYEKNEGINERMDTFLSHGTQFLAAYQTEPADSKVLSETSDVVAAIARNGFIQQLDDVVTEHQRLFESSVIRFKKFETLFLAFGLLLLVMEVLFIFRPMANVVENSISALKQRNQELGEFSLRLSHDLRAPIASSLGMMEIAEESHQDGDAEEVKYALARVSSLMKKLDQTIINIVGVTRAGISDPKSEVVMLNDVIDEVVHKMSTLEGCKKIQVRTDTSSSKPIVSNKVLLQQILENLVSNAIKYADFTQAQSTIQITAHQSGKNCQITVADNGIGIQSKHRDELFGMFQRFHPNIASGTGLGLYLVRQNAAALGGKIEYRPLEPGSQFTLTFVC